MDHSALRVRVNHDTRQVVRGTQVQLGRDFIHTCRMVLLGVHRTLQLGMGNDAGVQAAAGARTPQGWRRLPSGQVLRNLVHDLKPNVAHIHSVLFQPGVSHHGRTRGLLPFEDQIDHHLAYESLRLRQFRADRFVNFQDSSSRHTNPRLVEADSELLDDRVRH